MLVKKDKKPEKISSADINRAERTRRKAKSAATYESGIAAELKNREHGAEQPAR